MSKSKIINYSIIVILIIISILTCLLYKNRILILFNQNSVNNIDIINIYTFVWTIIMVFSIDVAITQFLYKDLSNDNNYMGVPVLHSSNKFYFVIHRFITHKLFWAILSYFIISPLFITHKSIPILFLYIWQTSYIFVLLVLMFLILSDFSMMHCINESNRNDLHNNLNRNIENHIFHKCNSALLYDIKSNPVDLRVLNYIGSLWKKIILNFDKSDRLSKIQTFKYYFQINKLVEIASSVILNPNNYEKIEDPYKLKSIAYQYIIFLQDKITPPIYNEKLFIDNTIQMCVNINDEFLPKVKLSYLNENNIIKTKYIFPFQFINERYIRKSTSWKYINHMFEKSSFVKESVNLSSFKYGNQSHLQPREKFVSTNIKRLILNEIKFLYSKFTSKDNDIFYYSMLNSLKSTFPKFFKGYINSKEFIDNISLNRKFRQVINDFNNLSKLKYYKKYDLPYLSHKGGF